MKEAPEEEKKKVTWLTPQSHAFIMQTNQGLFLPPTCLLKTCQVLGLEQMESHTEIRHAHTFVQIYVDRYQSNSTQIHDGL